MASHFPAIVSAFFALVLYSVTLGGTYVFDDVPIVRDDLRVRNPSQWSQLWTRDYFDGGIDNLYRPLVSTSYAIEWFLHGDRPWVFHLVNILLHAGASAAVAELVLAGARLRSDRSTAACVAGLLFAAHPLHVEAVANIVGRAESACTLAILIGLLILIRKPLTRRRVFALLGVASVAVLCKEQGLLQPVLWTLLGPCAWFFNVDRSSTAIAEVDSFDLASLPQPAMLPHPATLLYATPGSNESRNKSRSTLMLLVLMTTWLWAGYLLVREHFLKFEWERNFIDKTFQPLVLSQGIDRVLMPIALLGRYVFLFVWPARLSPDYGGDVIGHHTWAVDPFLWTGFAAVVCWCVAVGWAVKKKAGFELFCLLSLAVTYGMVSNALTLIGTNFAERLTYLPSVFLIVFIALRVTSVRGRFVTAIFAIVLLLLSVKTVFAARLWNDPLKLFEQSLVNQPKSAQLHFLLSTECSKRGEHDRALVVANDACRLYPVYWRAWMFLALAEMDAGDFVSSRAHLTKAISLNPPPTILAATERLERLQAERKLKPGR